MKPKIGLALTGSFCTIGEVLTVAETLTRTYEIVPILSEAVRDLSTRFFTAGEIASELKHITGRTPLATLPEVEPLGPKADLDLLVLAPCTGNTLAKLAAGIADSTVTLAAKAHLRNARPLLLAPATNNALSASAASLGKLLNEKHVYFVPFAQDDPREKPSSVIARFSLLPEAIEHALQGKQLQPILQEVRA